MKFYHNPRCSKSRQALALLEDKKAVFETVLYLVDSPGVEELRSIVSKLGFSTAHELMRTKESIYKELGIAAYVDDEAKLFEVMANNPKLIERPILVSEEKAVIGRPPESVLELLN